MLLYLGLSNPGTFVPEVLGGISLVLAIHGMGLFDTNLLGILLIVIGIGLLIAEAFTAGFGIMGIGGAASLLIGANFTSFWFCYCYFFCYQYYLSLQMLETQYLKFESTFTKRCYKNCGAFAHHSRGKRYCIPGSSR